MTSQKLPLVLLFLCSCLFGFGQSIFTNQITENNISTINPYTTNQVIDGNITVSGIGYGIGVFPRNGNGIYNTDSWDTPDFDDTAYFEFTLIPNFGYEIDFLNFVYTSVEHSSITNFAFRSSIDNFTSDIGTPVSGGTTIDLSAAAYQNMAFSITFRLYAWGANRDNRTFGIDNFTFNGIVSAIPTCVATTTWNGSSWDNGIPNLNTIAIINGDYDTSNGNFESCELIINTGSDLIIRNNTYIKVQNSIVIDGNLVVEPLGSFVQVEDSGTFTVNPGGSSRVDKQTANLNDWYEYTYWSSPVVGETVEDAFPETPSNRRFWYNAQNFLDQKKEISNNNILRDGQDDIDDNGDDWEIASGVMEAGLGYAATYSQFAPYPIIGTASFNGAFNTGDITVSIYKNDLEANDNNWNLIGNPYPSAIDADLFLLENTFIDQNVPVNPSLGVSDGAIFFWSQNSDPSSSNNGNENLNFAQSDYAIINSVTQVAGGDGLMPTRHIPSGQAFFMVYDHDATEIDAVGTIKRNEVKFTNSMRVADGTSNNQFFKRLNNDNKLWLNLTSDNGVFNQVAIVYVDGATDRNDGSAYDTERNLSVQKSATIYTRINSEKDKQYVIQAKAPESITPYEIISIGFKTEINVPTLYQFSIPKFEGDFLKANAIYLKDKLLNTLHSLKDSDYVFTSDVGDFNNRFEIVFRDNGKPIETLNKHSISELKIIEHQNGNVQFVLNSTFDLKNITIFDLQGKMIYNLQTNDNSKIFNLSNLKQTIYIAQVELTDGSIITKKLIKGK